MLDYRINLLAIFEIWSEGLTGTCDWLGMRYMYLRYVNWYKWTMVLAKFWRTVGTAQIEDGYVLEGEARRPARGL